MCCVIPKSYTVTPSRGLSEATSMLIAGMAGGAGIGFIIAKTTEKPANFSEPETAPKTVKDKIKYFYAKNYSELRTLLFSVAGAISGGLLLYVPRIVYEKLYPLSEIERNKKLCEQEIAEIEERFNRPGILNLSLEEQQLFDQIEKDLTIDRGCTDPWGNHHGFLQKPRINIIITELRNRLIDKVKIKYVLIEQELTKKAKQEQKPELDETYKCPICLNVPTNPQSNYNCTHSMCADCYDAFVNQPGSNKCPVCRKAKKR